ncbi:hypothetical protein LTR48_008831, partial [Friedmanniomyces endolithicus]
MSWLQYILACLLVGSAAAASQIDPSRRSRQSDGLTGFRTVVKTITSISGNASTEPVVERDANVGSTFTPITNSVPYTFTSYSSVPYTITTYSQDPYTGPVFPSHHPDSTTT